MPVARHSGGCARVRRTSISSNRRSIRASDHNVSSTATASHTQYAVTIAATRILSLSPGPSLRRTVDAHVAGAEATGYRQHPSASAIPLVPPVRELDVEQRFDTVDVVLERRNQAGSLVGQQRRTESLFALQQPDKRLRHPLPNSVRHGATEPGTPVQAEAQDVVDQRVRGGDGDVGRRYVGDDAALDPEESEERVECLLGQLAQVPVEQDEHLLAREHREEVLQLRAVVAEPEVAPERRPPRIGTRPLELG